MTQITQKGLSKTNQVPSDLQQIIDNHFSAIGHDLEENNEKFLDMLQSSALGANNGGFGFDQFNDWMYFYRRTNEFLKKMKGFTSKSLDAKCKN